MENKERFTTKTKLDEILKLGINEVAKLRWDKYQECWNAKNFIWNEFYDKGEKSPVDNINLEYKEKFSVPLPITELAKDFLFYVRIKENLMNLISYNNLINRYIIFKTDPDKYYSELNERFKKNHEEQKAKLKKEIRDLTIQSGKHLKVVK